MQILIVVAVEAEHRAISRGISHIPGFDILAAGVGPISAAIHTSMALTAKKYDFVISTGIGGGFAGRADIGALVVSDKIICADLGAQTLDGFLSLDELGFGSTQIQVDDALITQVTSTLRQADLPVTIGHILTTSTVTGTHRTCEKLIARIPGASAEGMEGFGVAAASQAQGIPAIEIRAISNLVGPRDITTWRIQQALDSLSAAFSVLSEVFFK